MAAATATAQQVATERKKMAAACLLCAAREKANDICLLALTNVNDKQLTIACFELAEISVSTIALESPTYQLYNGKFEYRRRSARSFRH